MLGANTQAERDKALVEFNQRQTVRDQARAEEKKQFQTGVNSPSVSQGSNGGTQNSNVAPPNNGGQPRSPQQQQQPPPPQGTTQQPPLSIPSIPSITLPRL